MEEKVLFLYASQEKKKKGKKEGENVKSNNFQIPALKFNCLIQQKFEHLLCNRYCSWFWVYRTE